MASFLTAFGVGGVVARYYNLSHPAASGVHRLGRRDVDARYQFAKLFFTRSRRRATYE
jgi:hypothetical protein